LGPTEYVPPEDGDRIQSPKHCVLNKNRTVDNIQKHNNFISSVSSSIRERVRQFWIHTNDFDRILKLKVNSVYVVSREYDPG
jgi:hypothetical protein